jgi:VanZ family protein
MTLRNPLIPGHASFKWILVTFLWSGSIAWLSLIPRPPHIHGFLGWDKLQHAGAYGLLSLLVAQTLSSWPRARTDNAWWQAGLAVVCFGGLMEVLQLVMHAGRSAEWGDLAADALGAALCCVLFRQIARIRSRRQRPVE